MIEILQFIFSSFWTWIGTLIIITSIGVSFSQIICLARGKK